MNLHTPFHPLLAISKCDTGDWLLSKAIIDNKVSDDEFQITSAESTQYYNVLKEAREKKSFEKKTKHSRRKFKFKFGNISHYLHAIKT